MTMPCQGCGGESLQDAIRQVAPDLQPGQRFLWRPLSDEIHETLDETFKLWLGTKYVAGSQARGGGVDCTQLIGALLDTLFRNKTKTKIPRLPQDAALHSGRAGFQTAKAIRRAFPSTVLRDFIIEPGDVIVTRSFHDDNGPRNMGHVMFTGSKPWTAIHATPRGGVAMTGLQATNGILRVYRILGKDKWVLPTAQ